MIIWSDALPANLKMHSLRRQADIPVGDALGFLAAIPDSLVPLDNASWPDDVKSQVEELFELAGVPEPLERKLVEFLALAFKIDGETDWGKLVDYFRWEARIYIEDYKEAAKLQTAFKKKYGHLANHYAVYDAR